MWKLMLLAGCGGFIGTCCRFLINRLFVIIWKSPFPLATFTINILGCFLFGLFLGLIGRYNIIQPKLNAFLLIGLCGGFTTFSSFSFESLSLANSGQLIISCLYIGVSIIAGLIAVGLGMLILR